MNLLPPPGPQRTRQLTLLILLGLVATFFVWRWSTASAPAPASNPQNAQTTARGAGAQKSASVAAMPEPVKLDKLEPVPDEPGAGRNLFRFGTKPAPPPPPTPPPAPLPPPVQQKPPEPTGPPPIDLQLKGMIKRADGPTIVVLKDPKTDATLNGSEGSVLDGKYKILKVGDSSVIVAYLDGTGQRTIVQERRVG